ncbi:unnamed protein product [Bursaphelenchus okinawaensis]|uniref:Aminopeptidase n=1 Tax=Bursaphelenchus okinawaensis TaxID=465554 RepID=A0A811KPP9_9BILA|nr:unnamed protein product [Bursaphelenchus okinawaensis]CAG9109467.1 unnamed protein product [Bursaphelenchus okinawaensis]
MLSRAALITIRRSSPRLSLLKIGRQSKRTLSYHYPVHNRGHLLSASHTHHNAAYFLSTAAPAIKQREKSKMADTFSKLPTYAHPTHYKIHLKPNLETFKCEGEETVNVTINEATNKLQLHSDNIEVKSARVKLADGMTLTNLPIKLDKKWGWLQIDFPSEVQPQNIELTLEFIAEHSEHLQGFYRSKYKDAAGNTKYMVSTQFESTYARKAFPCWDEPTYKATFDVELTVDKELVALSNMPFTSESEVDGKKVYKYATTPIMSSYLIAFAVGEFEYIEEKAKTGTQVRIYTVPGKKEQGRFALEVACRALEWYTEWFAQPYPIPKCDLIAIPDFSMGAMENWGLVTYREVCLLINDAISSHRQKSQVALVVAHELAHFWFGNLVTMKWWTDLWLKEGFASFMEYLFVANNKPEFKIWLHFVNDEIASGFNLDSLKSSHPIEIEIDNPNELDEIYDSITYAKSNSINRMLYTYLGEERFRAGLRVYLDRFKYNNAVTLDLWKALSEASGEDVNKMMSSWTKQVGFPIVQVSEERLGDNKRKIILKQQRFLADGSTDDTVWQVPIGICTASKPNETVHKILLTKPQDEFVLEGVSDGDWIKLNASTAGFYQVQYSDDMLQKLLLAIKDQKLDVLDRFGITNDLFAQVKAGKATPVAFLSLVAASINEQEYIVWGALDNGLATITNALARASDPSLKEKFNEYVRRALEPVGERLGWEKKDGEDSQTSMLRSLILGRLCKAGHEKSIATALQKFNEHVDDKKELHPDLRMMIYGVAARNGGQEGLAKLQKVFETCDFPEIERNAILAMGQVKGPELLSQVFEYGIINGKIRPQDLISLFVGAASSPMGQDFAWQFFQKHYQLLISKFGSVNSSLFQYCLKFSGSQQSSSDFVQQYEGFCKSAFDSDQQKVLDRPIKQTVENILVNQTLRKECETSVAKFLIEN